jgi:hypothetical protein
VIALGLPPDRRTQPRSGSGRAHADHTRTSRAAQWPLEQAQDEHFDHIPRAHLSDVGAWGRPRGGPARLLCGVEGNSALIRRISQSRGHECIHCAGGSVALGLASWPAEAPFCACYSPRSALLGLEKQATVRGRARAFIIRWPSKHWRFGPRAQAMHRTIYWRATREDIFQGFARQIAKPIDMEDVSARERRPTCS